MERHFEQLFARATAQVDGQDANRALWDVRAELEAEHSNVVCYEMVIGEDTSWDSFLEVLVPRLTEHLIAKGLALFGGPNVVLSVWSGPTMYMFQCSEFFGAIRDIEQLSSEQLKERIGDGRVRLGLPRNPRGAHAAAWSPLLAAESAIKAAPEHADAPLPAPVQHALLGPMAGPSVSRAVSRDSGDGVDRDGDGSSGE